MIVRTVFNTSFMHTCWLKILSPWKNGQWNRGGLSTALRDRPRSRGVRARAARRPMVCSTLVNGWSTESLIRERFRNGPALLPGISKGRGASSGTRPWPAAPPRPRYPAASSLLTSSGTTLNRSPTIPKWATSKIGALGSELMATIMSAPFMPARCWMAPLIPQAM
jgi:hypothetical protein